MSYLLNLSFILPHLTFFHSLLIRASQMTNGQAFNLNRCHMKSTL